MKLCKTKALKAACALSLVVTIAQPAVAASVSNNVIFGSGNANGDFTVDTGTYGDPAVLGSNLPVAELGVRAKLRFDQNNQPQNTFNYDGVDTYTFDAGLPPSGFGFAPGSTGTAIWNFEWSIGSDSQFLGLPAKDLTSLNALTYMLRLDGDPTAGTNFLEFDPINLPFADHALGDTTTAAGAGTVAADAAEYANLLSVSSLAQNSWNYEFFNNAGTPLEFFDARTPGSYRIELEAFYQGNSIASTGINVNVVPPSTIPLPAAGWMLIAGLGGLALLRRRQTKTA
ncbi:VPLPA-CTERM sorting domain-containing protein [Roseovarius aestuariivivens]|uniref:VPLPA-CTERM sorting domain-containing protein n=1 Tax=Roseovarius aestuariivivens TaxID=1888910 RepID=UPI001FD8C7E4|nr:VPLPA-CTERM sorting domain-containing protein [Roseovarius aestuariivivens]